MLETVRRHAAELAVPGSEHDDARDGLLRWAVAQAAGYQHLARERGTGAAMELADREQHNLRAALDRAATGGSAIDGITVIADTDDWWRAAGHTAEAWERLRQLLDLAASNDAVPERTWLHGVTCLAVFAAFLDEDAQRVAAELVQATVQRLEHVADHELRLRLATELAWVQLDLGDRTVGRRLGALLAESRRLGGLMESSILHYLGIWQLTHGDLDGAHASADACAASAHRSGNDVSTAHSAELWGLVLTGHRRAGEARDHLEQALRGMVSIDHLGCVLHCMESIAWWASSDGRDEHARRLLGLTVALRRALRRTRFSVERHAYEAAVARSGEPIPPTGTDLIGQAFTLVDELFATTEPREAPGDGGARRSIATDLGRALSRPSWL
jgi:hypothetical protein